MSAPSPFWVVWNPEGNVPFVRHQSRDIAQGEAERLARNNPGQSFYVLASLSVSRKSDVETTHFDVMELIDEVPF